MNEEKFWTLIENVYDDDQNVSQKLLIEAFKNMTLEDCEKFRKMFHNFASDIGYATPKNYDDWEDTWGDDHMARMCKETYGHISDDTFEDFKEGLVAAGRHVYYSILNNPTAEEILRHFENPKNIIRESYLTYPMWSKTDPKEFIRCTTPEVIKYKGAEGSQTPFWHD